VKIIEIIGISIKKTIRLIAIIVHVLWGYVQVLYAVDEKKGIKDKERALIKQWFEQFLHKLNIEKKIHGEIASGNHLMVSNHISWKDVVVLNSVYPTRFIAKSDIRQWPLVGWLSARTGTLFVKRGSTTDARRLNETIAQLLNSGNNITLFPEGATSDGRELSKFYPGLFQSALDAQKLDADNIICIQPVVLIYTVNNQQSAHIPYLDHASLAANFWTVLGLKNIRVDVYFTAPINIDNMTRKELSEQSFQQMKQVLLDHNY